MQALQKEPPKNSSISRFMSKSQSFLTNMDEYGHPIELKYKGESTFKTQIGGFFTLISRCILIVYLYFELNDVHEKKSTVTVNNYIRNLALDKTEYKQDASNFDFAIKVKPIFYMEEKDFELETYLSFDAYMSDFYWVEDDDGNFAIKEEFTPIEMVKCPEGRFKGENKSTELLGIWRYLCPKEIDFATLGSWSAERGKYLAIDLIPCY